MQAVANDYGEENLHGFEQAVEEPGVEVVYEGRHKTTATDLVFTITTIKNSGCEMLVPGPRVKNTILITAAARDAGWNAPIIMSNGCLIFVGTGVPEEPTPLCTSR